MKKYIKSIAIPILAACLTLASQQAYGTLSFSSLGGSAIHFDGAGNFGFTPGGGSDQFQITTGGSAFGDLGNVSGSYAIGAVTISGGNQSAPVTGSGTLTIHDGLGSDLTGGITWVTISSSGTAGALNIGGVINLSTLAYSGTEADLLGLAASGSGIAVVSFTFIPGKTVTELKGGIFDATSYSGTLTSAAVPEPTTVIAGALLLLPFGASTLRILRRNRATV